MCNFTEYQETLTVLREEKETAKTMFTEIVEDLSTKLKKFKLKTK